MLLDGFQKEVFLSKCNPNSLSVHCDAHLDQDISEGLPYLNTVLGGGDVTCPRIMCRLLN